MKRRLATLAYANASSDASFQISGNVVYISNRYSRWHAWTVWTCAAVLAVLPFVLPWLAGEKWNFDQPLGFWVGVVIYVLTIGACISAGWWWSNVRIDVATRHVTIETRWGLFSRQRAAPLERFSRVVVECDVDGDVTVDMLGVDRWTIGWGRGYKESAQIAREVADRLGLSLEGVTDE